MNGNSDYISYVARSPNYTPGRSHKIDTITIHHMAGNLSVETCGAIFSQSSRKASSNYGIDSFGRIALYVDEKNTSWCSSNRSNDARAVTIEVANCGGARENWPISDKAMSSLVKLLVDICQRNGIRSLKWRGDKSFVGQTDKQNMTVHRWFTATACPGEYLYNNMGEIADRVNKMLGAGETRVWYEDDLTWAISSGISESGERPEEPATRAEMFAVVHRLHDLIMKEVSHDGN